MAEVSLATQRSGDRSGGTGGKAPWSWSWRLPLLKAFPALLSGAEAAPRCAGQGSPLRTWPAWRGTCVDLPRSQGADRGQAVA